jgi:hypothetical protein
MRVWGIVPTSRDSLNNHSSLPNRTTIRSEPHCSKTQPQVSILASSSYIICAPAIPTKSILSALVPPEPSDTVDYLMLTQKLIAH